MSVERARWKASELVPLAERLRYMQLFRLLIAVVVVVFAVSVTGVDAARLGAITAAYVVVSAAGELVWRAFHRRGLALFGAMLIVDGLFLGWAVARTGGTDSPLRLLMVLHLVAVALLASYRTGVKLALWHSILLVGVFNLEGPHQRALITGHGPGTEFERLVTFVAVFWLVTLSTAAFSAINERELRRRRYDLEALAALASRLETVSTPAAVADVLVEHVLDAFSFTRAVVVRVDGDEARPLSGLGEPDPFDEPAPPLAVGALTRLACSSRETLLIAGLDADADPDLVELLPDAHNLVVLPLTADGTASGVLVAEHALRSGSRIERRVVTAVERFASHAALSLRNATLLEAMQRMADSDPLTGIANRRTFETTLRRELDVAARANTPVSLVLLDVDHFKGLNDTYGHQRGDEVLRELAGALSSVCRRVDTPARYGGEEFIVIAPRCTAAESYMLAERIRAAMAAVDCGMRVTVSAGVASWPLHADDADGLVRAADAALYESKRHGRDRVTRAHAVTPSGKRADTAPAGAER